ncbi:thiosulfate oxidation carrier protein SoxY [Enhydrobacter aerosaccus]|uniref:thiosulfate oxidation carrier protein SoxY n=1 Tax=Enhydrobacter aerosaccus TaxID=225324 RepID=UPI003AF37ECF
MASLTRRSALLAIAGAIVARNAWATPDATRDWLASQAKGTSKEGKITLKAPEIAENGNAVPVTVSVESAMTEQSYVKALYVAADGNPNPGVITFEFTPASGKAEVQFRTRLAQTQKLVAVAEMNDGSLYMASREVKVTIGGCGG